MSVKFDAITPVLTPEQVRHLQQRATDRQLRQQRFGDERRVQLLNVAWALWCETGAQGFNMRQLAQRAGYTAGALYAYFPGRDAILSALQLRVIQALGELVRLQKASRAERGSRARTDGVPILDHVQVARQLFMDRSLAWWGCLAGDAQRLQLVLHGGPGSLPEVSPDQDTASEPFAQLTDALQPCLDALRATGLPPECAAQLHDEVLAYGLGLLVLQGQKPPTDRAALESRFVQSLQRWLDVALAGALGGAGAAAVEQGDLFAA
ncbi:MAG: TetR/AcrR family transcriptional regulator [Hydrogenophaga sp.]|nr:TetR/AcrR family transcriptional regulator [Hydrogenophaga sp.]